LRISKVEPSIACRNCGRLFPATKLDQSLWCADCRRVVIRRAYITARISAMTMALGMIAWLYYFSGPEPRFLLLYMLMCVSGYYFTFKLVHRVAFEIIRARGVKPPVTAPRVEPLLEPPVENGYD
jgi:hypothetical protein